MKSYNNIESLLSTICKYYYKNTYYINTNKKSQKPI